jgi:hypothetical protein
VYTMNDAPVTAKISRLTADQAEVEVAGRTIIVPAAIVPEGVAQGDEVVIELRTKQQADAERQEFARALLTEILGGTT